MKRLPVLFIALAAAVLLAACGGNDPNDSLQDVADIVETSSTETATTSEPEGTSGTEPTGDEGAGSGDAKLACPRGGPASGRGKQRESAPPPLPPGKQLIATLQTSEGVMTAELFGDEAPNAVSNFVVLACSGFYTNVKFHRIIDGFMVQTGDPEGTGTGGPGYTIEDDPVKREYEKGTLAMANTGAPNTAGSQFFIVHGDDVGLPKTYTIFGKVTKGLDVLDKIAATPVEPNEGGESSLPTRDVTLRTVFIAEA